MQTSTGKASLPTDWQGRRYAALVATYTTYSKFRTWTTKINKNFTSRK